MTSACNSWMEPNPKRKEYLERFEALFEATNGADTCEASWGADQLMKGRAAFWSTSGYSDQFTGSIRAGANLHGSLTTALIERNWRSRGDEAAVAMLDRLIPMNAAAVRELQVAYQTLSTFRNTSELASRESRALSMGVAA